MVRGLRKQLRGLQPPPRHFKHWPLQILDVILADKWDKQINVMKGGHRPAYSFIHLCITSD